MRQVDTEALREDERPYCESGNDDRRACGTSVGCADQSSRDQVELSQDRNATEDEREHSVQNWRMMLEGLKQLLEK